MVILMLNGISPHIIILLVSVQWFGKLKIIYNHTITEIHTHTNSHLPGSASSFNRSFFQHRQFITPVPSSTVNKMKDQTKMFLLIRRLEVKAVLFLGLKNKNWDVVTDGEMFPMTSLIC